MIGARVPLADAFRLWRRAARRTLVVRAAAAAALVVLAAVALAGVLGLETRSTSYFAEGARGIVVADFSASINEASFQRMARVLRTFVSSDERLGLVVFSDNAYEVFPPGTSGEELRPMLRFFVKDPELVDEPDDLGIRPPGYAASPWSAAFPGGTQISRGLALARRVVERDGIEDASILLVSDLEDAPSDRPLLTAEVDRYQRAGIEIKVVPLFPQVENLLLFRQLVGPEAVLERAELVRNTQISERRTVVGDFPLLFVLAAAALLVLLGANERVTRRLRWRPA